MFALILLTGVIAGDDPNQGMTGPQFAAIVKASRGPIKDISFVYEGEMAFVGPKRFLKGPPRGLNYSYQGSYVYRDDEATVQDIYTRPSEIGGVLRRRQSALLNWNYETRSLKADRTRTFNPGKSKAPGAVNFTTGSATRMLFYWFFDSLKEPENQKFEFQGWEIVDGHKCLRVELDSLPGQGAAHAMRYRLWIDLERGGHPLKFEMVAESNVRMRIDRIRLERLPSPDGITVWFPVTAVGESFMWDDNYYSFPLFRETYSYVAGSLRVNQNLPDERFSISWSGDSQGGDALQPVRREFEKTPPFRTDAQGVQERLNQQLAQADLESRRLEASSAARAAWPWTDIASAGLIGVGAVALCGVALRRLWGSR